MNISFVTPSQMEAWINNLTADEKERHIVVVRAESPEELRLMEEITATLHDNNVMR